ncbi:MAG: hypothetical protein ACFE8P_03000 [Promethearchaeota archaeon]
MELQEEYLEEMEKEDLEIGQKSVIIYSKLDEKSNIKKGNLEKLLFSFFFHYIFLFLSKNNILEYFS